MRNAARADDDHESKRPVEAAPELCGVVPAGVAYM